MIRSLSLTNFQSHPSTTIEFGPGINAILGASDKGKSAILRGFEWTRTNRPNGDAHVSDWAIDSKGKQTDECRSVVVTDKHRIERVRFNKVNGYVLDGAPIEATNGMLPPEITEAFGLLDLNVQKQLDGPFLLSQTGGEVARFFNSLVNLEEIDHCMTAADGLKREILGDIRRTGETIESTRAGLSRFSWVDDVREDLARLKETREERAKHQKRTQALTDILDRRKSASVRLAKANETLSLDALTQGIRALWTEREALCVRMEALRTTQTRRRDAVRIAERLPLIVSLEGSLDALRVTVRDVVGVSYRLNKLSDIRTLRARHRTTLDGAKPVVELQADLEKLQATLGDRVDLAKRLAALSAILNRRKIAVATVDSLTPVSELSTSRLAEFLRMRSEKEARFKALSALCKRRKEYYTYIELKNKEITALEAQLPELCPTCKQPYRRSA